MNKMNTLQTLKRAYHKKWKYVLVMLPILFFYVLFAIYPNIQILPMSLYKWSPIRTAKEFVGLHNFEILFSVQWEDTIERIGNAMLYIFGLFAIQTVVSLILAVVLQKNSRKNNFFRTYFFLPMVFSTTMVSLTWAYMFDPNLGVINTLFGIFGVEGYPGTNLFAENWEAILLIVLVHIWANIGYPMTILISGLNTISGDLNEAAMIDGANSWQTFTKITFPLLLPTLLRLSLLTITTGAMASDFIVMLGSRNSMVSYDTMASWMYKQTLLSTDYGLVSAAAVVMFVFLAVASLIQFLAMQKVENKILG